MQVQSTPFQNNSAQHPYNPNMFGSTTPQQQVPAQYTLQSQPEEQQNSEEMFFALERLLMGITPFPPTIPTLAKPTCPSLDDQIMAEIQATNPSSIPSIVLNEQSLDLLQQFYQTQDNLNAPTTSFNYSSSSASQQDQSECSSTSRSVSPPSSPYSYSSSLVSSPAMPLATDPFWVNGNNMLYGNAPSTVAQQQSTADWGSSLFDQITMPLTMTSFEGYIDPPATENTASFLCQQQQQVAPTQIKTLKDSTSKRVKSTHNHRRSSSSCSAISAYESPVIHREHRASSISSVCSAGSTGSGSTVTTTTGNTRPVKSYACPTCTKPFPTRTQLKSHMAIHTDLFPFPCLYAGCELHFKRKHDLRRHVDAKHAVVKKYLCTGGCGEGFGRRDQMVRHLRRGTCGQAQGFQTD